MTYQNIYTCDECQKDISKTSNCTDYRIGIYSESIPPQQGALTLLNMQPPFIKSMHFCAEQCMKNYFIKLWGLK